MRRNIGWQLRETIVLQEEELNNNRGEDRVRSSQHKTRAGRTGWPQAVWALELKQWGGLWRCGIMTTCWLTLSAGLTFITNSSHRHQVWRQLGGRWAECGIWNSRVSFTTVQPAGKVLLEIDNKWSFSRFTRWFDDCSEWSELKVNSFDKLYRRKWSPVVRPNGDCVKTVVTRRPSVLTLH